MKTLFFLLLFVNVVFAFYIQMPRPLSGSHVQPLPELQPEGTKPLAASANCLEWASFFEADLEQVEAAIARQELGDKISRQPMGKTPVFWIHIPPLRSKYHAIKKMGELGRLKLTNFSHVQDDSKWNNAISMGFFHNIDEAQNMMVSLRSKGVRSAVIGARNLEQIKFVVQAPSDDIVRRMTDLEREFPGSELKRTECNASEQELMGTNDK
ncbi:hypothetical protein C8R32_107183 [Nitrosospira sp. Nsp5]|uniref:Sporulation related protein n=1 Tax=Nitrosospira multiformis TaxID=1231 RepID=A0ABY0T7L3_9PROT|nr:MULTISPECIES: hypothetical protein [Nitrosospira]PTR07497.1 hypothetical protein C8R32_107183 [Nitrosospira sp. Nsp5]SDQ39512.1 hypothetical protein SAMN05216402_0684 [Nitrosospira multiformis]